MNFHRGANLEVKMEKAVGGSETVSILRLSGELDSAGALKLEDKIQGSLGKDPGDVLVDLEETPYICSVGIGVLIGILNRVKAKGGRMAVVHLQPDVEKVLRLTGILRFTERYGSETEALASLGTR